MKEQFEKWFIRVVDKDLYNSLEQWQLARVKELAYKAYKKRHDTKSTKQGETLWNM